MAIGSIAPHMWDLPGSGIKPVSPAVAGGFFTTEPLGKPPNSDILILSLFFFLISWSICIRRNFLLVPITLNYYLYRKEDTFLSFLLLFTSFKQ